MWNKTTVIILALSICTLGFARISQAEGADTAKQKELFNKHCKNCHAEDGSGKKADGSWLPVHKTLKLEKPELLSLLSDEAKKINADDMEKGIMEGRGKKMKPMKDKITADEAKMLVKYVMQLQGRK